MSRERETLEIDVLFVGAGPASLAGALHLSRLLAAHNSRAAEKVELAIAVLEKGAEVGSHGLSGAVVDPRAFRELVPAELDDVPFEAPVAEEHLWWLTERRALALPEPAPLRNRGNYVASLGKLVKWMAKKVEAAGVDVFCEFPGRELLFDGERVAGVRTGDRGVDKDGRPKANFEPGVDIRAQVTLLGEGPRGTLALQLERRLGLTAGRNPQVYAIGIKELWELPAGRFAPGDVWHSMGWPLWPDLYGGGFLYGMQDDLLIAGLVVGLDGENPWTDAHLEFQRYKTHPEIRKLLEGGKMVNYGAKAIPEGGWWAMPKLGGDGFCLLGDSGGFLDGQRLKGIHLAMKSGMLAAEAIFEAAVAGRPLAGAGDDYPTLVESSWAKDELWASRNFHQGFEHGGFNALVNAALGQVSGGRGFGLFDRLSAHAGHERMRRLDTERRDFRPAAPVAYDNVLTFDRLADVYQSGTAHEEDQPVHLLVADPSICVERCTREFANPCTRFCPAAVYEIVEDAAAPAGKRLQINASNCVHCKTCDIADPYQIITWVPPEGGGGPNYGRM
ncbi:MAG TPA: electron transfer flavoprotein-ubiquinone oxidoreductase [Thermoanaerobaculia bacterium]|nr:electron transfer flavoprotein-ubiquinone oxidoreductase [Thermoanaerobaculia bacterium]